MTLEEKIKIIEEKIANLPSAFNVEERHIINHNKRLMTLLVETIINNPHLCDDEVFYNLTDEVMDVLATEYGERFYTQYITNLLKKSIVSISELEQTCNQINLSEEQTEIFRETIRQAYANPNYQIEMFSTSQDSILQMLEYKRYDLISQLKNDVLTKEVAEQIIAEYPFDKYPFPYSLIRQPELLDGYYKYIPIEYFFEMYLPELSKLNGDYFNYQDEQNIDVNNIIKYTKIFLEKIKEKGSIDLSSTTGKLYQYNYRALILNDRALNLIGNQSVINEINEIAIFLFKNGIYEIAHQLYEKKLISLEEIRTLIIKIVLDNNREDMQKLDLSYYIDDLKDDNELLNILLENGFAQEVSQLNNNYLKNKKNYIIEQLNNKNENFRSCATTVVYDTREDLDLYIAQLESGFALRISISSYKVLTQEELQDIKNFLITYPNVEFDCSSLSFEEMLYFMDTLLQTNRLSSIINYLRNNAYNDLTEIIREANKKQDLTNLIKNNFDIGYTLFQDIASQVIQNSELMDAYSTNDIYIEKIIDHVNHNEDLIGFYNEENYQRLKHYIARKLNTNIEKIDKIENIFGPFIFRYLENENIIQMVSMPEEELDKLLAIFPKVEYTMQDLQGTYDSLKQYEFGKKHSREIQVFPTLLHAIEDEDDLLVESLIDKIAKELDNTFVKRFLKKYDLPEEYTKGDITNLVRLVVEKIKISKEEKLEKYKTILHEMTDYYISKKREQYRETYNMEEELSLPYTLDEKSVDASIIKYMINISGDIHTRIEKPSEPREEKKSGFYTGWRNIGYYTLKEIYVLRLVEQGIDKTIAEETIEYYINKDKSKCTNFKQVQKTIPSLIKVVKEIAEEIVNSHAINKYGLSSNALQKHIEEADNRKELKRTYFLYEKYTAIEILTQLNIPILQKSVLSNPEVYESLLKTIDKRKIHMLPHCITNILGSEYINISPDLSNIAGFISYYSAIYDAVKSNLEANGKSTDNILMNITNILIYADVYSSVSSVYSQILGSEDAKLIKANPGPNAATKKLPNDGRLKEAVELTKMLYERQEITIPSFIESIPLESGKQMKVVVGNFTHPSNLTHGERTGACMRIGGVGESLFEFALTNPNGFHIRFENPKNNEYISRVTGFRNGNTVFLNELRNSCNQQEYSDEDVIDACRQTAKMLIELSKDSPCPIENIVVHRAYATNSMPDELTNLKVSNIKEGLPKFYSDVHSSAIILATSSQTEKFVPVNLDKTNVPTYQPAREKPIVAKTIQEATGKINRVASVKRLLAGENYEFIEPCQFTNGLIYAIVSDDWYVYVDENGQIISDIIDIDPRAKEELAEAIIHIENNLSEIKSENQEAKYGL